MNELRKKWQLDRVERAIQAARLNDADREQCFWPCVHLASSLAGSDTRLILKIAKTRIKITAENAWITCQLFFERLYYIRIKGWTRAEYEAHLDTEFESTVCLLLGNDDQTLKQNHR